MPATISLGRGKHASTTAHVTEGTLTGATSTTTTNTGNTRNSAASTPGFSRGLVTGFLGNSVGLTGVLGNVGVHKGDQVGADGSREDGRELQSSLGGSAINVVNGNQRTSRLKRRWMHKAMLDGRRRAYHLESGEEVPGVWNCSIVGDDPCSKNSNHVSD